MVSLRSTHPKLSFPAEWEPHEATWLGWPHNLSDWPGKIAPIRWGYGEMVRKLTVGEIVRIFIQSPSHEASARRILSQAGADMGRVEFFPFPTNRGWTRDLGPIFVRNDNEIAIAEFTFNAWAKYSDWQLDNAVSTKAAKALKLNTIPMRYKGRDIVLEGGAIDVNGKGTLLTTEECLLDQQTQVRNPAVSKTEMEDILRQSFGVSNILWLGKGIAGDDTHGHVDDLCRFVDATTVVLALETNSSDVNYKPLQENRERLETMRLENGSKVKVVPLPMPAPLTFAGDRLPASYANFYIGNAAVLVPTFNDPNDRVALGILSELFTDRPVVGIHAVDLVLGYGTLHCLTQQQPARKTVS